jgi:hypothetical protein
MKWTIHKAAAEWGVDRRTLAKRLTGAGLKVERNSQFTTQEITQAIVGDLNSERIRETRARADLLELERREKQRELVSLTEVQKMIFESFQPIRDQMNALPSQAASRCNPTDPALARQALEEWLRTVLPLIRNELPKPAVD